MISFSFLFRDYSLLPAQYYLSDLLFLQVQQYLQSLWMIWGTKDGMEIKKVPILLMLHQCILAGQLRLLLLYSLQLYYQLCPGLQHTVSLSLRQYVFAYSLVSVYLIRVIMNFLIVVLGLQAVIVAQTKVFFCANFVSSALVVLVVFCGASYWGVVNTREGRNPMKADFLSALLPLVCIPAIFSLFTGLYKW